MRKPITLVLCLIVSACAGAVSQEKPTHLHPHYEGSLFKITDKGYYSVELLVKDGHYSVGSNTLDLIVHKDVEGNRDVENAIIKVVPWMPMMGHGVNEEPVITERGAGLYSAENVVANMEGPWELKIDIQGEVGRDTVTFEFPDVRMPETGMHGEEGHMMMQPMGISRPPEGTDLSTSRKTAAGHFMAAYEPVDGKVTMNRIHSWHLTLTNLQGNPVKGANVTVAGNMPEHGHGLPTKPAITRELTDGVYLVEGMKFSMPGWWILTFDIEAGEIHDQATFNVDVR